MKKSKDSLTVKHTRLKKYLESRPVIKYALELVTIVLGISISFAIENWQDDRQEEKIYQTVLEEIIMDMELDSAHCAMKISSMDEQEQILRKVIANDTLLGSEVREWFYTVTGNMGGITVRQGGYQHWRSTPGISFKSSELSQSISTYYTEIRSEIDKHNAQLIDNFQRAQNYIIENPIPILTSFYEDDPRFEKELTVGRFSIDVEKEYRNLLENPTYFYMTEVKLYLIINENSLCQKALDVNANTLSKLREELSGIKN